MDQVYDNKFDGQVNNLPKVIETKEYTQFVDKDSAEVFNYNENTQSNTDVYGDYEDTNTIVNFIGVANTSGATVGALGASATNTYVVVQSPSNYAPVQAASIAAANTAQLSLLAALLSGNPALSSLLILPPSGAC
jgi:hypothetical protein